MKKDLDGKLTLMASNMEVLNKRSSFNKSWGGFLALAILINLGLSFYILHEQKTDARTVVKAIDANNQKFKTNIIANRNGILEIDYKLEEETYVLMVKYTNIKGVLNDLVAVQNDCQYVSNFLRFKEPVIVDVNDTNPMNLKLHCHLTRNDGSELIITAENARKSVINHKADLEFEEKRRKKRGRKKAK